MAAKEVRIYRRVMAWGLPRPLKILLLIASNWLVQMVLYMDPAERRIRLLLEGAAQAAWIGVAFALRVPLWVTGLGVAVLHTAHWLGNGHLFALLKTFGWVRTPASKAEAFIAETRRHASKVHRLRRVWQYGSGVRGEWTERSDLDLIVARGSGVRAAWAAYRFVWGLRLRALRRGFPVDVYLFDEDRAGYRISKRETPRQIWP
jgi:predicted nucleotidyltransferase